MDSGSLNPSKWDCLTLELIPFVFRTLWLQSKTSPFQQWSIFRFINQPLGKWERKARELPSKMVFFPHVLDLFSHQRGQRSSGPDCKVNNMSKTRDGRFIKWLYHYLSKPWKWFANTNLELRRFRKPFQNCSKWIVFWGNVHLPLHPKSVNGWRKPNLVNQNEAVDIKERTEKNCVR